MVANTKGDALKGQRTVLPLCTALEAESAKSLSFVVDYPVDLDLHRLGEMFHQHRTIAVVQRGSPLPSRRSHLQVWAALRHRDRAEASGRVLALPWWKMIASVMAWGS